jgi:uncharacterized membrane protein YdjX (TVP38/TMEM64 family)
MIRENFSKWLPWLVILLLVAVAAILWRPLSIIGEQNEAKLSAEVARLGALAPLSYLALSIIQIVGAPIPGYPVQLLGGVLFGAVVGGIYAVIGMLAGGLISTWLARRLGRPFIEKQIDPQTLARYDRLTKLETFGVWVLILLLPTGDIPYYLAGLSRVKYSTLALAILASRGPFSFVFSWAGANSLEAPSWVLWGAFAFVLGIVVVGYLLKDRITFWLDRHVLHRLE